MRRSKSPHTLQQRIGVAIHQPMFEQIDSVPHRSED